MGMLQTVRYQVFVSSTFTDLKDERSEVIQALWELDCIPTGMEAFVAANESQWEVIKKVIDECDYYVLIIGGRYGSVTAEGISYTEKEFNYAKELRIPVLAFVHTDPESLPVSKSEKDEALRSRLEAFRARVMQEHPVRQWRTAQELGGLVSRSVSRAIKVDPRPGWVRNSGSSNLELLEQINALTKDNSALREKLEAADNFGIEIEDLANADDTTELRGHVSVLKAGSNWDTESEIWVAEETWDNIFRDIGRILLNEATETAIAAELARYWSLAPNGMALEARKVQRSTISPETLGAVIVQFRALRLIEQGQRKRAPSDKGKYWMLTRLGERHLTQLLAVRKNKL